MPLTHRQTHQLSHNRISLPGSTYFLTLNTKNRQEGLTQPTISTSLTNALRALHKQHDLELLCGTIMPDHIHLLIVLGKKLRLSQIVSKFKCVTKSPLTKVPLLWQRNYYDHRIRHAPSSTEFARYIFLNPYRKRLIQAGEKLAHWIRNRNYTPDFLEQLTTKGTPPP